MSKSTPMYGVRLVVRVELKIIMPKVWIHAADRCEDTLTGVRVFSVLIQTIKRLEFRYDITKIVMKMTYLCF